MWDFSKRSHRRFAWREIAKEDPLLVVSGETRSKRGEGEHRRFVTRVCRDQFDKGRYYVQQGEQGWTLAGGESVQGRSGVWTTNSRFIRKELAEKRRCSSTNKEDDIAAILRGFKEQLRSEGLISNLGKGVVCCEEEPHILKDKAHY